MSAITLQIWYMHNQIYSALKEKESIKKHHMASLETHLIPYVKKVRKVQAKVWFADYYLWILRLQRGMWCICGGNLAHSCAADLEWIHNNVSLCSLLSVRQHTPASLPLLGLQQVCAPFFGVPRNLWWCKKIKRYRSKGIWAQKKAFLC